MEIAPASLEAARDAGLRWVADGGRGIRRVRNGRGFSYRDTEGRAIRDRAALRRIDRLAIPPAWTDVWIAPDARGHIQATGRDARGRKQYRYHERWREVRDADKYSRLTAFGRALSHIRSRVRADLRTPGLARDKVIACVVLLLEASLIRVGNDEYARANRSFGLTTLRGRHVRVRGARVRFRFRGKSGKEHEVDLVDERIARVVKRLEELPGQELFQCRENGEVQAIGSDDVNAYLREVTGDDFTAKDFRTWAGTVLLARTLASLPERGPGTRAVRTDLVRAVATVAERLGNTPAVCKRSYVHPAVVEAYESGALRRAVGLARRGRGGLDAAERAVLRLLERSRARAKAA
ncbi:MAG: DNA topoisomerase IB [Candidatus Limnocylindria bacterium]